MLKLSCIVGALFAAIVACGCDGKPHPDHVVYECVDRNLEEARAAADYEAKCIEAGGKGVRSTEDWVQECHRVAADLCHKELVVVMDPAGSWAHIPCRIAGKEGKDLCAANGWSPPPAQ